MSLLRSLALLCVLLAALQVAAQRSHQQQPQRQARFQTLFPASGEIVQFSRGSKSKDGKSFQIVEIEDELALNSPTSSPKGVAAAPVPRQQRTFSPDVKLRDQSSEGFLELDQIDTAFAKHAGSTGLSAIGLHLALQDLGLAVSPRDSFHLLHSIDADNDTNVSIDEFLRMLEYHPEDEAMTDAVALEVQSQTKIIGSIGSALGGFAKDMGAALFGMVNTKEDKCVVCQYIVERIMRNVQQSSLAQFNGRNLYIELSSSARATSKSKSQQQTSNKTPFADNRLYGYSPLAQGYRTVPGFAIGGGDEAHSGVDVRRGYTAYVRQQERALYNQIYRIMDLTLDDVCEQAMPPKFYKYCKDIYKKQQKVVDGLRYQYRPSDICMDLKMCTMRSYIANIRHSRYKRQSLLGMAKKALGGIGSSLSSFGHDVGQAVGFNQ